jgi:outer membrane protein insertion porin family
MSNDVTDSRPIDGAALQCRAVKPRGRSSAMRVFFCLIGVCIALLCQSALAQTGGSPAAEARNSGANHHPNIQTEEQGSGQSQLTAYDGQTVSAIQIAGRTDFDLTRCPACLIQAAGQPFSLDKVQKTAAALKEAGHCTSVDIQVEPDADGVHVIFVMKPAVYFGIFTFPGAERLPYSQLIEASNYPLQKAFNPSEVTADEQTLLAFYQQEGFFEAHVRSSLALDTVNAVASVQFDSDLGKLAKFGWTAIEGAPDAEAPALEHKLTTLSARFRGAGIRAGKTYHRSTVNKARDYLQNSLQKQGYLGAQVKLSGAQYEAAANQAAIHFAIKAGPKTQVDIEGTRLWSWDRKSLLPIYQGVGVDDETVAEGRLALISYFQAKGFFDVKVESHLEKGQGAATVNYNIAKEKKHKVTAVGLAGDAALPSSQLTPQIAVEKKRFFSPGKFSEELVQTSINNLKAVYQSEGFSEAKVTSAVRRMNGDVQVQFHVVEGPRNIVNSLTIEGADTFPESSFAPHGLKLAKGQPYSQSLVQDDRAEIVSNYLKAGYLIASFRETAARESKGEPHRIDVVYHIHEGPRVMTGNVLTLGRAHAQQRLIDGDTNGIRKGQSLTESELLIAGSNLYNHTGVFDWAEVDPKEPVTTQTTNDVLVKVHEGKRNDFSYGLGFEVIQRGGNVPSGTVALPNLPPIGLPSNFATSQATFYGPRGTVQYTRNDMRGKGETFSLTGFAGRLDQRAAVYYIDPSFRWTSWKATTSVSYEKNEENPIFSSAQTQGTVQFQHPIDKDKKTIFFLQYAYSNVNLTRILIPQLVPAQDQHVELSTFSGNITRDTRDNPLNEHTGMLDSLELDFNSSKLGSSVDFAKMTGQAAIYREKFHHIVWAESIRIGLAQPFNGSFVPLSEQFFTGGGDTLRGFPLDSAGPQRQVEVCSSGQTNCPYIQVPTGGNEMLILNSEARIPLPIKKGLRLAVFYDGGNVFPSIGFQDFMTSNQSKTGLGYANNVGFGLRYATPVGPIRIDIGRNLNPVQGVQATNFFIGIGQAF